MFSEVVARGQSLPSNSENVGNRWHHKQIVTRKQKRWLNLAASVCVSTALCSPWPRASEAGPPPVSQPRLVRTDRSKTIRNSHVAVVKRHVAGLTSPTFGARDTYSSVPRMLKERQVVAWNCTTFIQSIGIHVEAVVAMSASQCFTSTSPFINKVCTGTMRAHNFSFSRDGIETKHGGTRHQHAVGKHCHLSTPSFGSFLRSLECSRCSRCTDVRVWGVQFHPKDIIDY